MPPAFLKGVRDLSTPRAFICRKRSEMLGEITHRANSPGIVENPHGAITGGWAPTRRHLSTVGRAIRHRRPWLVPATTFPKENCTRTPVASRNKKEEFGGWFLDSPPRIRTGAAHGCCTP